MLESSRKVAFSSMKRTPELSDAQREGDTSVGMNVLPFEVTAEWVQHFPGMLRAAFLLWQER